MDIRISKNSAVPIRQQLADEISFLIATGQLKSGESLPSVRELARRLGIHHNTVSEVYHDLVNRKWLLRKRGARLATPVQEDEFPGKLAKDVDDLINATIRAGRRHGYSLQTIRNRVQERLLAEPPDHILVVERELGLRRLLQEEIRHSLGWPTRSYSQEDLVANRGLVVGSLITVPQYASAEVVPLAPKDRPAISIRFGTADSQIEQIRGLRSSSLVAIVSVSPIFLKTASSLLTAVIGERHSLCGYRLEDVPLGALKAADLVICDSIAVRQIKHPRKIHYQLIDPESMGYLGDAMQSYHSS